VNDPVTGAQTADVPVTLRSNPTLQPEDARAFTGGVVYSPKFIPALTVTIDFFDIESKGRVNSFPNINDVLLRAAEGRSLFGERVSRDANGEIISIQESYLNGGSQKTRGIDFGIQYQVQTGFGTFASLTQVTYVDSFEFADTPDVPEKEFSGTGEQFNSTEANFRWKGTSRLDWSWNHFDLGGTVNYRDGFHEHQLNGLIHYVKQTWFFDAQLSYDFTFAAPAEIRSIAGDSKSTADESRPQAGKAGTSTWGQTAAYGQPVWQQLLNGTSITLGCNDVFGQDPPRSFAQYPVFAYDPTGRFIYVSLTKKF
jgi:outer membrane receptor protein involved in Fe transport